MDELLEKINETFDNSIETCDEDVALQLKILKGNINTLFKEYEDHDNSATSEIERPVNNDMKNILVVDDSSLIRNYVEKICMNKYNVIAASGGQEAIDVLSSRDFDLILLDLMMPNVNGFAVLDFLKDKKSTPVIIISGDTTKETIDRAFTYNVVDMIEKPFQEKVIMEKIERVLE